MSPAPETPLPAPGAARPPRRRWRVAAGMGGGLALVGAAAVPGVAWYFSGLALTVTESGTATTSVRAGEVDTGSGRGGAAGGDGGSAATAVLSTEGEGGASAAALGLHGVRWEGGWGIVGEILGDPPAGADPPADAGTVTRTWQDVEGELPAGPVDGVVFQDVYDGDPGSRGLAFEDVVVTSDVGELPAWLVPAGAPAAGTGPDSTPPEATGADWVVFVHGWGGSRRESLRYLPTFHELGWTTLVPTYRNDEEAPADPSGRYRLGESEWRDIDAALGYARASGAERVVLAGWSLGGAIALQALDRSEHADLVVGLVLNAPVLDWRDTFRYQGSLAGLPQWWSDVAIAVIERRARLDVDDYDWVSRASELDVPVYLVHSTDDRFVPSDPSVALAEARPDLVTFRPDGPADHTREWNVDPAGYEADLQDWLTGTLSP